MDPKMAAGAEAPDEKVHQYTYRSSDLTAEEAAKAPGGFDFIADKNKIDETYALPVNASKKATWATSAITNVTAMVGAGVLGLPYAMRFLLWPAGTVLMVFSWITTVYTLWQMCALHEIAGRRFNRYHELGQFAFGRRLGLWLVLPCQLIVMIGLDIVYCVTAGTALSAWISVFGAVQIFLAQIPNFHSLTALSLLAALMSITYSTIAIAASAHDADPNAAYNLDGLTTAQGTFGIMNALGTIAFAYGGHNVVLEIQSTMPSDGGASGNPNPTLKPMMLGVYIAYLIVGYCYLGVGFTGYYAFGSNTGSQIIYSIGHPIWPTIFASVCIIIHVCGSFQVYAMPVFDMIEYLAAKVGISAWLHQRNVPLWIPRIFYRSIYVVLVTFIAILLPFFGDLLGFIGALGFGPTTFTYPPIMWLILKKPKITSWQWWACYVCAIYGIIVTIFGAIGGLQGIIVDASNYKTFQ